MLIKIDHPLPSSEERRKSVTDKLANGERVIAFHVPRKHISERTCHGKDVACLPGLNGKCVACFDDD